MNYRYSEREYEQESSGGSSREAYVRLSVDVIGKLFRARAISQAGALGLLLHRQADMRKWSVVKLPTAVLSQYGFDRRSVSRALQQLERAGLILVHRKPGKRSTVTGLWHPLHELCFDAMPDEEDEL